MHEDDLEDLWKGPLDEAEAGISRHNSWRMMMMMKMMMEDKN